MSNYARRFTERRRQRGPAVYNDGLVFDRVKDALPSPQRSGRNLLLLSFVLQGVLVLFGFLMHHHRKHEFGCCNIWAIVIALLFIALQWTYYSDWCSKLGGQALWHRANMFVPFFVFSVLFIMWLGGVLSLLAHAEGKEFFEMEWSLLSSVEVLSFIVMSSCFFVLVWIYVALAVAHRNNLGVHYYGPGEEEVAVVHMRSEPEAQNGSFNNRNMLGFMARVVGLETSFAADRNMRTVMAVGCGVQVPFYLFAGIAYGQDNNSALLITLVVLGIFVFVLSCQYFWNALDKRVRRTRKWNRTHLFFPLYVMFMVVWTYFFTMATVFFQVEDPDRLWEDILLDSTLTPTEKAYFALSTVNLFAILFLQLLIANLHRKAWAEGTAAMDDGLPYGPPDEQGRPTFAASAGHDPYDMVAAERGQAGGGLGSRNNASASRVSFKDAHADSSSSESDSDVDVQVM